MYPINPSPQTKAILEESLSSDQQDAQATQTTTNTAAAMNARMDLMQIEMRVLRRNVWLACAVNIIAGTLLKIWMTPHASVAVPQVRSLQTLQTPQTQKEKAQRRGIQPVVHRVDSPLYN